MSTSAVVVDWYAEGQAARRKASADHIVSNTELLKIARKEYALLRNAVNQREAIDSYRQYIRGFYNPINSEALP